MVGCERFLTPFPSPFTGPVQLTAGTGPNGVDLSGYFDLRRAVLFSRGRRLGEPANQFMPSAYVNML